MNLFTYLTVTSVKYPLSLKWICETGECSSSVLRCQLSVSVSMLFLMSVDGCSSLDQLTTFTSPAVHFHPHKLTKRRSTTWPSTTRVR